MGAENGDAARRNLVQIVDEMRALGPETLDHVAVVHDLVAHIDRRPVFVQRALDNVDGALDSGAETPRLGKNHPHDIAFLGGGDAAPEPRPPHYKQLLYA